MKTKYFPFILILFLLVACNPGIEKISETITSIPTIARTDTPTITTTPTSTQTLTPSPTPTFTFTPTPSPIKISADNAQKVEELVRIGNGIGYDIQWWPDNETLAVVSKIGIYLYDFKTYEFIKFIEPPDQEMLESAVLCPDGNTIVSMHERRNNIRVWEADSGKTLQYLTLQDILTFAISNDGTLLAVGTPTSINLYDVKTGKIIRTIQGGSDSLAFSLDGKKIISFGIDPNPQPGMPIGVYDVSGGYLLKAIKRPKLANNLSFHISKNRDLLAIRNENEINIYDLNTGSISQTLKEEEGRVFQALAISHDSTIIASFTKTINDCPIKFWDASTGLMIRSIDKCVYPGLLTFSPDGNKLIGMEYQLWTLDINFNLLTKELGKSRRPYSGSLFLPEKGELLVFYLGGVIQIFDSIYNPQGDFLIENRGTIRNVSLDGEHVYTSQYDMDKRKYFDRVLYTKFNTAVFNQETNYWYYIQLSPDNQSFVRHVYRDASGTYFTLELWNIKKDKLLFNQPQVNSFSFSNNGSSLAISASNKIIIVDTETGEISNEISKSGSIRSFNPDDTLLVTSNNSYLQFWDTTTLELVRQIQIPFHNNVSFSSDFSKLISIASKPVGRKYIHELSLWDVESGNLIWKSDLERENSFKVDYYLFFNPSNELIITAEKGDGFTQLWSVETGEMLWSFPTTFEWDAISPISMSPDGNYISIVRKDGVVRIFGVKP